MMLESTSHRLGPEEAPHDQPGGPAFVGSRAGAPARRRQPFADEPNALLHWLPRVLFAAAVVIAPYLLHVRPWLMHWGASDAEQRMGLAGDPLMPAGSVVSTRAIFIDAPVADVWSWLVQLGQGRGGFYSYDWLENIFGAGMRNAETIEPGLQTLAAGDTIAYMHEGPTAVITVLVPERVMVIGEGWTFALRAVDPWTTRLVVRYPYDHGGNILHMIFYYTLFEPVHFVMESGMMLGIKRRAEERFAAIEARHEQMHRGTP